MLKRRKIRELALQSLFAMDAMEDYSIKKAKETYKFCNIENEDDGGFFNEIIKGLIEHKDDIDKSVESISKNWKIKRMPLVDRNIIRIASYEILYKEEIPCNVSINEAIDISKKYSTRKSGAFINGILDKVRLQSNKENNKK